MLVEVYFNFETDKDDYLKSIRSWLKQGGFDYHDLRTEVLENERK